MIRSIISTLAPVSRGSTLIARRGFVNQFFDDTDNLGVTSELRPKKRPGRSWTSDELRLKSNTDLHKLWFVCLKERNMLLTVKKAYIAQGKYMPNPERIDRVDETMEAIKEVVDERDEAVLRLETGDGARPPSRTVTSFMGFTYKQEATEHLSKDGKKEYEVPMLDDDAYMMQKLWAEKEHMKKLERHDEEIRKELQTDDMRRFKRGGPRTFNK
ncbi:mrpl-47, partial [Pristionchus pacificus]